MHIPRPNLTAIAMTVATLALVVIAVAVTFNTVGIELQRRELARFTSRAEPMGFSEPRGELELETFVVDVSQHVSGDPGEEVTVELSPGVWEVLGGGTDDQPVSLTSQVRPFAMSWTGFRTVISVLPLDEADRAMNGGTSVVPAGPVTLSVDTDEAWVVDFRRQVCPGDYASS